MAAKIGTGDVSFRLGATTPAAVYLGSEEVWTDAPATPYATLVSILENSDISGSASSTTGYIKVEWWDSTTNVYGTGDSGSAISWSKAVGGLAGEKTLRIYSSNSAGGLDGALTQLNCEGNELTSLDVSGLTELTDLDCNGNQIASLRAVGVGENAVGSWYYNVLSGGFNLFANSLSAEALDQLYADLATTTNGHLFVLQNPGTSGDDPTIATAKGWTVYGS